MNNTTNTNKNPIFASRSHTSIFKPTNKRSNRSNPHEQQEKDANFNQNTNFNIEKTTNNPNQENPIKRIIKRVKEHTKIR